MPVAEQARAFAAMTLCGAALGALYDALMLLRRALRLRAVGTGVLDLTFGVFCALGVTRAALALEMDAFTLLAFAGTGVGLGVYASTIGIFVRFLCEKAQNVAKRTEKMAKKAASLAGKARKEPNTNLIIPFADGEACGHGRQGQKAAQVASLSHRGDPVGGADTGAGG